MRLYEFVFILDPALAEEAVETELKAAQDVIAREGGEVLEVQRWGKKRLAYEIKRRKEGYYALIRFTGDAKLINEQERHIKLNEAVLRHLVVRVTEPKKPPLEANPAEEVAVSAEEAS
ncbi:MAG: 30S ribosomal protein S6 [candidate division NC10 bacterium]|nr:30S ribosomal protein S6 [candidate division NC10 bacterium]